MKIPSHIRRTSQDFQSWKDKAHFISLEYGIFVEIQYTNRGSSNDLDAIQFKVMGHLFEGEKDLRKALDNKAFL